MLITAWGAGASSFAQPGATDPAPAARRAAGAAEDKKFYIGYLIEGSDITNASARMEELKRFLLGRADFKAALAEAGFNDRDVVLSPCETPNNMVQRMNDQEFHLVFATAIVYARQDEPASAYEPILQFKLPGDIASPNRDGVLRQGVIFVGPRSPLFTRKGKPTKEELRELLARSPLAVPSADSAAGYLSPRHYMTFDLGLQTILPALFCNSDSEVIKHVVSGMAEVGACREGALAELGLNRVPEKYYKILCNTDALPTDPILLRSELVPLRSPLGVRLKVALREFFSKPELSVANASPRDFEIIGGYLKEVDQHGTAAEPPAAATPTSATPTTVTTPLVPSPSPTPTPAPATRPGATPPPPKPALPPMAASGIPEPASKPEPGKPEVRASATPPARPALPLITAPGAPVKPTPGATGPEMHPALPVVAPAIQLAPEKRPIAPEIRAIASETRLSADIRPALPPPQPTRAPAPRPRPALPTPTSAGPTAVGPTTAGPAKGAI